MWGAHARARRSRSPKGQFYDARTHSRASARASNPHAPARARLFSVPPLSPLLTAVQSAVRSPRESPRARKPFPPRGGNPVDRNGAGSPCGGCRPARPALGDDFGLRVPSRALRTRTNRPKFSRRATFARRRESRRYSAQSRGSARVGSHASSVEPSSPSVHQKAIVAANVAWIYAVIPRGTGRYEDRGSRPRHTL